jgi:hypothetical protein
VINLPLTKKIKMAVEKNGLPYKHLHDFYSSPNIWVIKSRKMRWVGHMARIGDRMCECSVLMGRSEIKGPLGRLWCRWRMILKCIFK